MLAFLQQVVSLTQIQLEEAMKPVRYEAPVPQQLPLKERGSMVLDPGTTVASIAGKDKLSSSATGPIGSLLAGDKIQFGKMCLLYSFELIIFLDLLLLSALYAYTVFVSSNLSLILYHLDCLPRIIFH